MEEVLDAETACLSGYHCPAAGRRQCAEGDHETTGDQTTFWESTVCVAHGVIIRQEMARRHPAEANLLGISQAR